MAKALIKSRLPSNKHKPKIKPELNNTKSRLLPHLQSFKQKLSSGSGFIVNKKFCKRENLKIYQNREQIKQFRSKYYISSLVLFTIKELRNFSNFP